MTTIVAQRPPLTDDDLLQALVRHAEALGQTAGANECIRVAPPPADLLQ